MKLQKGLLFVLDSGGGNAKKIEFMFNPSQLSFTRQSQWESDAGNRGEQLIPKVNFGGVKPYSFTLQKLTFDTYETRKSVMDIIENIKKGVSAPSGGNKRPPVYLLGWGGYEYFPCVMTQLTYTLNMFLNDGTPVRALVDISLQEVDKGSLSGKAQSAYSRENDLINRKRRMGDISRKQAEQNSQRQQQFRNQKTSTRPQRNQQQNNSTQQNIVNASNNLGRPFF